MVALMPALTPISP